MQHLRAWISYRNKNEELYFWRSRGGVEVDAVVYGKDGVWAFEIKSAARLRQEDFTGLSEFLSDYPMARTFMISPARRPEKRGQHLCLPVDEFLLALDPRKSLRDIF